MMILHFRTYVLTAFLTVVLTVPAWTQGGQVSVESRLDKSEVTVGELVKYEIIIRFSPELQVAAPPAGINLGGFEIRNYEDFEPVLLDSIVEKRVEFTIAAYDTGMFVIPPTGIAYMTPDSVADVMMTDAVNIRVESVLTGDDDDIRAIRDPLGLPFNRRLVIIIAVAVVLAGILGYIGYRYYRKRKEGKSFFETRKEPDRPAHELALEDLQRLRDSTLIAEGRIKEYYIELSDILRLYLQRRYYKQFLEMTTTEIKELLICEGIEEPVREKTGGVLDMCDFVKFAKFRPGVEDHERCLADAFDIVHETKIVMVAAGPEAVESPGSTEDIHIEDDKAGETAVPALPENSGSDAENGGNKENNM